MAARPLTDTRSARLGLAVAVVLVGAQAVAGAGWSLSHDDPTELELTSRCFTRQKLLHVEPTVGDAVASSASRGAVRTVIEGNLLTVAVVSRAQEAELLRERYVSQGGDVAARLEVRGRYVRLWHRVPSDSQRQTADACEY